MPEEKDSTAQDVLAALSHEVFDQMRPRLVERLADSLAKKLQWSLDQKVEALVTEFYEETVAPSLRARLEDSKDEILAALGAHAMAVGEAVGAAMVKKIESVLEKDYEARQVFRALIGGH